MEKFKFLKGYESFSVSNGGLNITLTIQNNIDMEIRITFDSETLYQRARTIRMNAPFSDYIIYANYLIVKKRQIHEMTHYEIRNEMEEMLLFFET